MLRIMQFNVNTNRYYLDVFSLVTKQRQLNPTLTIQVWYYLPVKY